MQIFPSTDFQFNKQTKVMSTECSSLGLLNGVPLTIRVKSSRTGKVVVFNQPRAERDRENDVLYWAYCPTEAVGVKELVVFND